MLQIFDFLNTLIYAYTAGRDRRTTNRSCNATTIKLAIHGSDTPFSNIVLENHWDLQSIKKI